jgi:hypothetical protein
MNKLVTVFVSGFLTFLYGCQSNPTYDTFRTLLPWSKKYSQIQPGFEYILVTANGHQALMALGSRFSLTEFGSQTLVHEYWYTGAGEMLHLVDGRINKALGFTFEIRNQTNNAPSWEEVVEAKNKLIWYRKIDLMPRFRYGVQNNVFTFEVQSPTSAPEFVPLNAKWVTDLVESKSFDGSPWIYSQLFAIVDRRVLYSEQCIDKSLCLKIRNLGLLIPEK